MDLSDLKKDIDTGALKPVYLFYGEEVFLKERYLAKLVDLMDEGLADFNLETVTAENTSPANVLEKARSMPFLNPPRIVIVRGADTYSADEMALFKDYVSDPNPKSCLVLLADKPDFRLAVFKTMRQQDLTVSFDPPKGRSLVFWVMESAEQRGYKLDQNAARTLIEMVGTNLTSLDHELEKVCLYSGDKRTIGVEEIKTAARLSRTASIFDLGDAVGEQDGARALTALKDLYLEEHYLRILAMIVRHFHLLLKVRLLLDDGARQGEVQQALKLPPFVVKKYLSQVRDLDAPRLKKAIARLLLADQTLKSSGAPDRLVLESMVLDLTSLRPNR
jgi:DNA polymerase-3 subunit delta